MCKYFSPSQSPKVSKLKITVNIARVIAPLYASLQVLMSSSPSLPSSRFYHSSETETASCQLKLGDISEEKEWPAFSLQRVLNKTPISTKTPRPL